VIRHPIPRAISRFALSTCIETQSVVTQKSRKKQRKTHRKDVSTNAVNQRSVDTSAPLKMADLARLAGRSRAAVSKACKAGGALHAAVLPELGLVDAAHPAARAYLAASSSAAPQRRSQRTSPVATAREHEPTAAALLSVGAHALEFGELERVRDDALERFGSIPEFVSAAQAARAAAEASIARRKDAAFDGRLIARAHVRTYVFGAIDAEFRRLLADASARIATTALAKARAGASLQEVTTDVTDVHSQVLQALVSRARRALDNAPANDSPPDAGAASTGDQRRKSRAISHALHARIARRMHEATPAIVDAVAKNIARAACGTAWSSTVFTEAMELHAAARAAAEETVANRLVAHVDDVARAFAFDEFTHPSEGSHAPV
jgi:hypothetical protein